MRQVGCGTIVTSFLGNVTQYGASTRDSQVGSIVTFTQHVLFPKKVQSLSSVSNFFRSCNIKWIHSMLMVNRISTKSGERS